MGLKVMNIQYLQIMDAAVEAFGNRETATSWLNQPSRLYDGDCPADAINTPEGYSKACRQLTWVRNGGKSARKIPPALPRLNELVDDTIMEAVLLSAGTGPEAFLEFCQNIGKNIKRSEPINLSAVGSDQAIFENCFCQTPDEMPLATHF